MRLRSLASAAMAVFAELVASQSTAQAPQFTDPSPKSAAELVPALDDAVAKAKRHLGPMDDRAAMATWRLMRGDRELVAVPRAAMLRSNSKTTRSCSMPSAGKSVSLNA